MTRLFTGSLLMAALALLCLAPAPARAAESYDNCTNTISSLPAVIATQGTWCFKGDLSTSIASGAAITVNTNNVTIDCNNFKLGGLAAGLGTAAYGVFANNRFNTSVRHCNVRGFYVGVFLAGVSGGGHAVEDNRFDNNTRIGIFVQGDGSVVRRNRVFDTGLSSLTGTPNIYGIATQYSVDVIDNTVSSVTATSGAGGDAYGIAPDSNLDGRVIGNGVRGLLKDSTGHAYGIYNTNSGRISVRDNDIVGDGSAGSTGVLCSTATGSVRDNVISAFATAITACTDSGGNNVIP
jgi:parallel beta-helix repeat protein